MSEGVSIPGDIPDQRRDAIEEAAESSIQARDRVRRLNAELHESVADGHESVPDAKSREAKEIGG